MVADGLYMKSHDCEADYRLHCLFEEPFGFSIYHIQIRPLHGHRLHYNYDYVTAFRLWLKYGLPYFHRDCAEQNLLYCLRHKKYRPQR